MYSDNEDEQMKNNDIKILLVNDPAIKGYLSIQKRISKELGINILFDVEEWEGYYNKVRKALLCEDVYDLVMIAGHLWKREFWEESALEKVNVDMSDILPMILPEIKIDNELYLFPSFCDGHIIVYRTDVMESLLGRRLPKVITPIEYIKVAKLLHDEGKSIVMKAHESEIFTDALPFLRMNGVDVYSDEGVCQCNKEEIINGAAQYCKLRQYAVKGTEHFGNREVCDALRYGEAVMGITWSGQMGEVMKEGCKDPEKLGFSTLTTAWNATWSFAINKKSRKKESAEKVLQYFGSSFVDAIVSKTSGVPIRLDSYENDNGEHPWYDTQLEMLRIAKTLPDVKRMGIKNEELYQALHDAFKGKVTAKAACMEAYDRIKALQCLR